MAHLLFKLRGVPDDEAEDIRVMLEENHIEYYETSAGNWGISMPGLWLNDDTRLARARALIEAYQQQRASQARDNWNSLRERGEQPSIWRSITNRPVASLGLLLFCAVIIYFSTTPFFDMLQNDP